MAVQIGIVAFCTAASMLGKDWGVLHDRFVKVFESSSNNNDKFKGRI